MLVWFWGESAAVPLGTQKGSGIHCDVPCREWHMPLDAVLFVLFVVAHSFDESCKHRLVVENEAEPRKCQRAPSAIPGL